MTVAKTGLPVGHHNGLFQLKAYGLIDSRKPLPFHWVDASLTLKFDVSHQILMKLIHCGCIKLNNKRGKSGFWDIL